MCSPKVKKLCLPASALMTVGIVSYIAYAYLWFYLPNMVIEDDINEGIKLDKDRSIPASVYIQGIFFMIIVIMIFWTLL